MATQPEPLPIGAAAPDFDLPATNGERYRLADFEAPVLVYVQGCNHCPYVKAYLGRLSALAETYGRAGVQFVMVNSNDGQRYPDDSFEAMKRFADEHELPFPYLYDESQEVARAYRTVRTPEVLVFDRERRLAYHGRIDDSPRDPANATTFELRDALDALLAGDAVPEPETWAVGCTVKWRAGNEPVVA